MPTDPLATSPAETGTRVRHDGVRDGYAAFCVLETPTINKYKIQTTSHSTRGMNIADRTTKGIMLELLNMDGFGYRIHAHTRLSDSRDAFLRSADIERNPASQALHCRSMSSGRKLDTGG
ncbi:hypothetical protein [Rhizobium straminoryzae]|uniref:Uncharacterized protein n=1 Tax=Rhizobium straminoryzae TaxID=1387186 RepID=A0A549SWI2_9HYPH|nr:hypothetical protein [Rhizobium straminoryzae]TRL34003.1 hypothetical protein FNA46_22125 [Rhizobium straminoryzae]